MSGETGGQSRQEFTSGQWFRVLSAVPDPAKRIRDLSDDHLDAALRELVAVPQPNPYQADLWVMCMVEAVKRWRANIPREVHTGDIY